MEGQSLGVRQDTSVGVRLITEMDQMRTRSRMEGMEEVWRRREEETGIERSKGNAVAKGSLATRSSLLRGGAEQERTQV